MFWKPHSGVTRVSIQRVRVTQWSHEWPHFILAGWTCYLPCQVRNQNTERAAELVIQRKEVVVSAEKETAKKVSDLCISQNVTKNVHSCFLQYQLQLARDSITALPHRTTSAFLLGAINNRKGTVTWSTEQQWLWTLSVLYPNNSLRRDCKTLHSPEHLSCLDDLRP